MRPYMEHGGRRVRLPKEIKLPRSIRPFAAATLAPVALLMLAAGFGGIWAWLAVAYMTALSFALDELMNRVAPGRAPESEGAAADELSVLLAAAHFILLLVAVYAVAGHTHVDWLSRGLIFLAFGMYFGQVSNSNAHELIHRSDRRLHLLGMWVFISLLFGHHTSAHRLVHHRYVATPDDPNTARAGESFWAFLPRAWAGSFRAGYEMERDRMHRDGAGRRSPYVTYLAGAAGFVVLIGLVAGGSGIVAYLLLAGYAQVQLLLSDYVQHYGLERRQLADGRVEPVSARHSWNADRWFSDALMLNAPLHSAHHAHPAWRYPELTLPDREEAPRLPYSLPVMGLIALAPRVWFRIMDRRLAKWRGPEGPRGRETGPAPAVVAE